MPVVINEVIVTTTVDSGRTAGHTAPPDPRPHAGHELRMRDLAQEILDIMKAKTER